jgi:hypothetical protein
VLVLVGVQAASNSPTTAIKVTSLKFFTVPSCESTKARLESLRGRSDLKGVPGIKGFSGSDAIQLLNYDETMSQILIRVVRTSLVRERVVGGPGNVRNHLLLLHVV